MKLSNLTLAFTLALTCTAATAGRALADRAPNASELSQLEQVLSAEGFSSWEEIEWDDDGYWEVDDAVDTNGRQWDLRLNSDLNIIERDD